MEARRVSHLDRLHACLAGEILDRPPVALWRHFPVDDQTPDGLAAATLTYQRTYDFDLVKVTPASSFCLLDWGAQDAWRGNPEGTRDYLIPALKNPDDWQHLHALEPDQGCLGRQLESLRMITGELGRSTPVLQTIFSPLSQAKNLVGKDHLTTHLRQHPDALHAGLRTIAETARRFIEAARSTGIAGVFYAVQHAQYGVLSRPEYLEFGRTYDALVLEAAAGLELNMLHLHGVDVMFAEVLFGPDGPPAVRPAASSLPVSIVNWHDQDTAPSLVEAQELFAGAVCGGLRIESVTLGNPAEVRAAAQAALAATGGRRFILGTGCVTPVIAPHGNILAVRHSVE